MKIYPPSVSRKQVVNQMWSSQSRDAELDNASTVFINSDLFFIQFYSGSVYAPIFNTVLSILVTNKRIEQLNVTQATLFQTHAI